MSEDGYLKDSGVDQYGEQWVHVGTGDKSAWVRVADFHDPGPGVFKRIHPLGVKSLTPAARTEVKKRIEAISEFRPILTALTPGWVDDCYVTGDGKVIPNARTNDIVIGFKPDHRYAAVGTKAGSQRIAELLREQPLGTFIISYAFVAPLLRFMPGDYINPQISLVGEGESGKTSLAVAGCSVWAGDRSSTQGGGDIFDLTPGAPDNLMLSHNDGLLLLDEGDLSGSDEQAQKKALRRIVMKLSQSGMRQRFDTVGPTPQARCATLMTSNTTLQQLLGNRSEATRALQTRLLTIIVGRGGMPILDKLPVGFASEKQAVESLRRLADEDYGILGPLFAARVAECVARDEVNFRQQVARKLEKALGHFEGPYPRINKTFAMISVAGYLAERWRILPAGMSTVSAAKQVYQRAVIGESPLNRIKRYGREHRAQLIRVESLREPLDLEAFRTKPGFLMSIKERKHILIPPEVLRKALPDCELIMQKLRDEGRARTEGGLHPKLAIKAPRRLCSGPARVYCIDLTP